MFDIMYIYQQALYALVHLIASTQTLNQPMNKPKRQPDSHVIKCHDNSIIFRVSPHLQNNSRRIRGSNRLNLEFAPTVLR
jgi:hypothetical protein